MGPRHRHWREERMAQPQATLTSQIRVWTPHRAMIAAHASSKVDRKGSEDTIGNCHDRKVKYAGN